VNAPEGSNCGDGIVGEGGHQPEHEGEKRGRCHELPGRNTGSTGDNEFVAPRQVEEARHRADQDAERQQALAELRHAEQGDLRDQTGCHAGDIAGPSHLLDEIDQRRQPENADEDRQRRAEKA
jgi:hypothetical protein